jgi:UDP:flavonoid glycosyltransferase YjiC (YdhE family)
VLRLAVERALNDRSIAERARELGAWSRAHDSGARAAQLIEQLAAKRR